MKRLPKTIVITVFVVALIVIAPMRALAGEVSAQSISIDANAYMTAGSTLQLKAKLSPSNSNSTIRWYIGNTTDFSIDQNGMVTSKTKKDVATQVTVSANGHTAKCIVRAFAVAPTSSNLTMSAYDKLSLGTTTHFVSNYPDNAVSWRVGNASILKVDAGGNVTAKSVGKTYLYVKAYNGAEVKRLITVAEAPTSISLDSDVFVPKGSTVSVKIDVTPSGSNDYVKWTIGNSNTATIHTGRHTNGSDVVFITGQNIANTKLKATASNGKTAEMMVRVIESGSIPTGISLPRETTVGIGESVALSPVITPADAVKTLSYRVGNSAVASVSSDGLVVGKAQGNTWVYVRTVNGLESKTLLRVGAAAVSHSVPAEIRVTQGESRAIEHVIQPSNSASSVTWRIGNPKIAGIDQGGVVKGVAVGNTYAYVKVGVLQEQKCLVRVIEENSVTSIELPSTENVLVGSSIELEPSFVPENANPRLTWRVGNSSIATVANGVVSGIKAGNTYVYATAGNGIEAKALIKVVEKKGFVTVQGKTYYYDPSTGALSKGYTIIDEKKYYFDKADGHMLTGWIAVGSTEYYFLQEGDVAKGLCNIEGSLRYFSASGVPQYGYKIIDGKRYYFDDETGVQRTGIIKTNAGTDNEATYLFLADGDVCRDGLTDYEGKTYWFNTSTGSMTFEMVYDGDMKYYFEPGTGELVTGVRCSTVSNPNNYTYYYDPNELGGVRRGLQSYEGKAYLFHSVYGYALSGYQSQGSDLYYFNPVDYKMRVNDSWEYGGVSFHADSDGNCSYEPIDQDDIRARILCAGFQKLGVPYGHENEEESAGKLDCSSFAALVYNEAGIESLSGKKTKDQAPFVFDSCFVFYDQEELKPGDLLFFDQDNCYNGGSEDCPHRFSREGMDYHIHHVAIYICDGQVIEAYEARGMVIAGDYKESDEYRVRFYANLIGD